MLDPVKAFRPERNHPPGGQTAAYATKIAAGGAALGLYSLVEPYLFHFNTVDVPLFAGGSRLDVLHISDTHMRAGNRRLREWLHRLPDRLTNAPDLVLATGDLIEDDSGIEPVVEAFARLNANYGCFYVLGSHDYFQSQFQAYTKYWTGRRPVRAPQADTDRLEAGLKEAGWKPVTNATETTDTPGGRVRITGVDDPYIKRHRTDHIRREPDDTLAIGLVHAPDVVSEYALHGFDLVVGGHTHAGQVRVPGIGALVTNCSLPAQLAGGLHRVGDTWVHVSPGLGSGRFAPLRFNCRPEVTLLRLHPQA